MLTLLDLLPSMAQILVCFYFHMAENRYFSLKNLAYSNSFQTLATYTCIFPR